MDFFQNHFNKKSFEESGHAPFIDVGEVQWSDSGVGATSNLC
jgi:hypothetical protein